jgi:transcription initiation factor IIE alpha subunit
VDKARAVEFECLRCEAKHLDYFDQRKTVHCKSCGNVAYPVDGAVTTERAGKTCKECGAKLRRTNPSTLCSSCDR